MAVFGATHWLLGRYAPTLWSETGAGSALQFSALLGLPVGAFLGLFFGFVVAVARIHRSEDGR